MLNESAARAQGWSPEEAIGKKYRLYAYENEVYFSDIRGSVVGVVEDFHVAPLGQPIEPLMLMPAQAGEWFFCRLGARTRGAG